MLLVVRNTRGDGAVGNVWLLYIFLLFPSFPFNLSFKMFRGRTILS